MGRYIFKLPDVGEGTAEAEIVAWHGYSAVAAQANALIEPVLWG